MSFIKLFKFACGRLPMSHRRFGKDVGKNGFEIEEGIRFVTEGDAFSGTEFLEIYGECKEIGSSILV